jgi:hypothetical protein
MMGGIAIPLQFGGYVRETNGWAVPQYGGVYCVYSCRNQPWDNKVWLRTLLYIGESENLYRRLSNHERRSDWHRHLQSGDELCYSFAPVWEPIREQVEAALIYHHKPVENIEYMYHFPFRPIQLAVTGRCWMLTPEFSVGDYGYADLYAAYYQPAPTSPLLAALYGYR